MTAIRTLAELDRWQEYQRRELERHGKITVTCSPWKPTRSNEQNALLWAMYAPLAEHMGYDRDDIHEWMCGRMWGWKDIKVPKTPRNPEGLASVPARTTTRDENGKRNVLSKQEFTKFVDMVDRIAAQAGVFIPMEDSSGR